ncbi:MAG: cytoplasmic protein [Desulfobulbaceae bacterium]|nr:MAG: cytoplasmic protein [Desulfobulbaceae bacterium]
MSIDPKNICFGLSEVLDRQSCALYLQLLGRKDFAELFAARLSSDEIEILVDTITSLLQKHLAKNEYHKHFLMDEDHHH